MNASIDGPRLARPNEFEETMALTNRCFGFDPGELETRMPHCFDRAHPERHAIIKSTGDIVSHIACIPAELHAGDARVGCGGIAGVATDPDHRSNGYMHQLLEFWLNQLDDREIPLAELEGDRVRYGRYGWENAGLEVQYRITERSFDVDCNVTEPGRPFRMQTDLELIRNIHENERYRVNRDRRQYERLLKQTGLQTLVADTAQPAYLCYCDDDPTSILEFGGSREGFGALLSQVLDSAAEVVVYTHPLHPLAALLRDKANDWELHPHRKLNVLDLPATLAAYQPFLGERWVTTIDAVGTTAGTVTIGMTGPEQHGSNIAVQSVTIAYDASSVSVDQTDQDPDFVLDQQGMVNFLFGSGNDPTHRSLKRSEPFLEAVLPLEYYFWQTETI